uniref:Reverse transcriptase domain-containing protein n=1 Tax=Tanacetum cinerariifolium TaxID=118510 RepID=A0A699KW30_TANCI|nr:reverse transcriptase domain-containing protein [Tanacetum cinerariifolium]
MTQMVSCPFDVLGILDQKYSMKQPKRSCKFDNTYKPREIDKEITPTYHLIRKKREAKPQYIGPFKILKRIGPAAYKLELPEELSNVHNTFYNSNLKKCLSDESLLIPMKELKLDDKLNFVEEPVEIMDREIKQL